MKRARPDDVASVLVSTDVARTADYYRTVLGFQVVGHQKPRFPSPRSTETASRSSRTVPTRPGRIERHAHLAGYDLYLDPEDVTGVDLLRAEFAMRGGRVVAAPRLTPDGWHEFVMEEVDGRRIGIGRVKDLEAFCKGQTPRGAGTA